MIPLRFTLADVERAHEEWGANCGPAAIAAIMGLTLDELRPSMGDFERKRYTNPTLMREVLNRIGARYSSNHNLSRFPAYGLARIQWEGPWTQPGVPMRARYRHTHWVGAQFSKGKGWGVFDINAMNSGCWISKDDWCAHVVPWIIKECVPRGSGAWHITHSVEIEEPAR